MGGTGADFSLGGEGVCVGLSLGEGESGTDGMKFHIVRLEFIKRSA